MSVSGYGLSPSQQSLFSIATSCAILFITPFILRYLSQNADDLPKDFIPTQQRVFGLITTESLETSENKDLASCAKTYRFMRNSLLRHRGKELSRQEIQELPKTLKSVRDSAALSLLVLSLSPCKEMQTIGVDFKKAMDGLVLLSSKPLELQSQQNLHKFFPVSEEFPMKRHTQKTTPHKVDVGVQTDKPLARKKAVSFIH